MWHLINKAFRVSSLVYQTIVIYVQVSESEPFPSPFMTIDRGGRKCLVNFSFAAKSFWLPISMENINAQVLHTKIKIYSKSLIGCIVYIQCEDRWVLFTRAMLSLFTRIECGFPCATSFTPEKL